MNPILIGLIFLAVFMIWVFGSFLFRPIGSITQKLIDDVKDSIAEEDDEKENDDEGEEY